MSRTVTQQRKEIEAMRVTIETLIRHELEKSKLHENQSETHAKTEAQRYRENLSLTKIAAFSGVIGTILVFVSIALQLIR